MSHKAFQITAELITMRESEVLPGRPRTMYTALSWRLVTSLTKNMPDKENHYQSSQQQYWDSWNSSTWQFENCFYFGLLCKFQITLGPNFGTIVRQQCLQFRSCR